MRTYRRTPSTQAHRAHRRSAPACAVGRLLALILPLVCAAAHAQTAGKYGRGLQLRARLDSTPASLRTSGQYEAALNAFRAVYHADRAAPEAAASVESVAELLAQEGRDFRNASLLHNAVEQLDFLRRDFSASPLAETALMTQGEIEKRDLHHPAAARGYFTQFLVDYPASPLAPQARAELRRLGAVVPLSPVEPAQGVATAQVARPVSPQVARQVTRSSVGEAPTPRGRPPAEGTWMADFPGDQPAAAEQPESVRPAAAPGTAALPAAGESRIVNGIPVERREERSNPDPNLDRNPDRNPDRNARHVLVQVTGIRQWSTASYTRIAVDLTGEVPFEASRVASPDRVFFDLHGARLAPSLAGRAVTVADGGFLERIRAAQFSNDVVRVVLDVTDVSDYSAFWLPDPARLIIDIHGRPRGAPPVTYTQAAQPETLQPRQPRALQPVSRPMVESDVPPPHTVVARAAAAGMPTPRAAKAAAPGTFVANTATRNGQTQSRQGSGDSVAAIAALSRQPDEVRATVAPTTAPVAAEVRPPAPAAEPTVERRGRRHASLLKPAPEPAPAPTPESALSSTPASPPTTPGEMARAAAPDASGGRSLVRALGLKINRIVIDAGHGGHDSGTLGPGGLEEKDVVLDVALRLGKLLKDRLGADVIYTRDTDTFIPLETRTAIANKAQADLFISIHANSSPDSSARGVETYYLNFTSNPDALETAARENAVSDESIHQLSGLVKQIALQDKIEESREFASDVQQSLYQGLDTGNPGLKDRGVKKAPFVVLIGANMPSILAEISFLTNPQDAVELREPAYRERIAEALYKGIARYDRSLGSTRPRETAAAQ